MERRARAGTQALRLLGTPLDFHLLQVLNGGPRSLMDLRRETGSPPQTTVRGHLRTLSATAVVTRQQRNSFPGSVDFELMIAGEELWAVANVLQGWLQSAPDGPMTLGDKPAQSAIRALVEGWDTNMVRALAARPLSLTELSELIAGISYPSLERRLAAMSLAGLIERVPGPGRRSPYAASRWLRRAVAPLAVAARWEHGNVSSQTQPIKQLEAEAIFLLTLPLLRLPSQLSGSCRLAIEIKTRKGLQFAGALAVVESGRVVSSVLQGAADAWVSGSDADWLRAIVEEETDGLEVGGNGRLARALLAGLHRELF